MNELRFDKDRLIDLMKREKMGDTRLAKKAGVSRTMIHYLKSGERKTASAEVISKIAGALNTTVGYLLGEEEGENSIAQVLPSTVHRLLEIAVDLSGVRQEELLRIAATLKKMEAEENSQGIPPAVNDVIRMVERIQPDGGDKLIQALLNLIENGNNRWLIDLGDPDEDDPEEPPDSE